MKIKKIKIFEEIKDVNNDNIDVGVVNEMGYTYIVTVGTPQDLLEEMEKEKTNFIIGPYTPMIIVKSLTEEIVVEAIKAYAAKDDGFWLKLRHFATELDVSIFNKLEAEDRKEWEGWEED